MGKSRDGYNSWYGALHRCHDIASPDYPRYGGRGITMCLRWRDSFDAFLADMGPRPSPAHSIDRIDNDGNYEPSNCRWATFIEQQINRSTTKLEPHEPRQIRWLYSLGYLQREIGEFFGIDQSHVSDIVNNRKWTEVPCVRT